MFIILLKVKGTCMFFDKDKVSSCSISFSAISNWRTLSFSSTTSLKSVYINDLSI